jgi:hypothetical protein
VAEKGIKKVPPLASSASPSHRSRHAAEQCNYTPLFAVGKKKAKDYTKKLSITPIFS